ncbi:hypothetical protein V8F20_010137 [Naviculisporaceae sp. PSN 640]
MLIVMFFTFSTTALTAWNSTETKRFGYTPYNNKYLGQPDGNIVKLSRVYPTSLAASFHHYLTQIAKYPVLLRWACRSVRTSGSVKLGSGCWGDWGTFCLSRSLFKKLV